MKTCPTCQRTYSEEDLTYCVVDGAVLSAPYDPNQTQILPESRTTDSPLERNAPAQSTILAVNPPNLYSSGKPVRSEVKRSTGPWLWIGLASAFGILVLAVIVGAIVWISNKQTDQQTSRKVQTGRLTPNETPSPSPNSSEEVVWEEHPNTSINEGERITFYPGSTSEACKNDCLKISNCRAYTFIEAGAFKQGDSQMCYLMSEVKTLNPNPGCYTGVKK